MELRAKEDQEDVVPKALTDEQIEFFNREGYLFPIDGIEKEKCGTLLGALEAFEANRGVNAGVFKRDTVTVYLIIWRRSDLGR